MARIRRLDTGEVFELTNPTSVGRAPLCDIPLEGQHEAGAQVVFRHDHRGWRAEDPSAWRAQMRVWRNSLPVVVETPLERGDEIAAGARFHVEDLAPPTVAGREPPARFEAITRDRERYPVSFLTQRMFDHEFRRDVPMAGYCAEMLLGHVIDGAHEHRPLFVRAMADERLAHVASVALVFLCDDANRDETVQLLRSGIEGEAWRTGSTLRSRLALLLALVDPFAAVEPLRDLVKRTLSGEDAQLGGAAARALFRIRRDAVADLAERAEALVHDGEDVQLAAHAIGILGSLADIGHARARRALVQVATSSLVFILRDLADRALAHLPRADS